MRKVVPDFPSGLGLGMVVFYAVWSGPISPIWARKHMLFSDGIEKLLNAFLCILVVKLLEMVEYCCRCLVSTKMASNCTCIPQLGPERLLDPI